MLEFFLDILGFLLKSAALVAVLFIAGFSLVNVIAAHKKAVVDQGSLVFIDLKKQFAKRKKLIQGSLKKSNPEYRLNKKGKDLGIQDDVKKGVAALKNSKVKNFDELIDDVAADLKEAKQKDNLADNDLEFIKNELNNSLERVQAKRAVAAKTDKDDKAEQKPDSSKQKTDATEAKTEDVKQPKAEQQSDVVAQKEVDAKTAETAETAESASTEDKAEADKKSEVDQQTVAEQTTEDKADNEQKSEQKDSTIDPAEVSAILKDKPSLVKKTLNGISAAWSKKGTLKQKRLVKAINEYASYFDDVDALNEEVKNGSFCPRNLYVIDFNGSKSGKEVQDLRFKIDAILDVATKEDEVIININSPGGSACTYGLCAAQLQRLRDHGIRVCATVDEVAASGGYLMACVADKIVAAPFAYIGSIGVIFGLPNVRRLLERNNIDYEQITAGKYKRTLSIFGENTEEGREKAKEEVEAIHSHFKDLVAQHRPQLDIEKVATGESWLAVEAIKLGLVDELCTSDEFIRQRVSKTFKSAIKIGVDRSKNWKLLGRVVPKVKIEGFDVKKTTQKISNLEDNTYMHLK